MTDKEALEALNELRSNIVATQSATWSNCMYPLVAILNAAGYELNEDPTEDQIANHLFCYGGAGGFPGQPKKEPSNERHLPGYLERIAAKGVLEKSQKRKEQRTV